MKKTIIVAIAWTAALSAQQHPAMPPGMTHEEHQAQMKKDAELKERGAAAMGLNQDAAAHRFRLFKDGGAIEVDASDTADQERAMPFAHTSVRSRSISAPVGSRRRSPRTASSHRE